MNKTTNTWNIAKLRKWLNEARKNRLHIDIENGFMTDGYSIFKIDEDLKKILNSHFMITGSIAISDGKIYNNSLDMKKIFRGFILEHEHSNHLLELTDYCRLRKGTTLNILYSDELIVEVNKRLIDVIDQSYKVKYYGIASQKPLAIEVEGEILGFILPVRNLSPYEIKKSHSTK
jgi:hypothetical protein